MSCYLAELDFPHLGGVSEQTNKMVHERAGHIHEVACAVQPAECGVRPQVATYPCQGVGEVRGQPGISRLRLITWWTFQVKTESGWYVEGAVR
jgi:hypothetical protein